MSNVTLSASLTSVVARINFALEAIVERVESQKEGELLTVSSMVEVLAAETGLDKLMIQLAASALINNSSTHHIVPGRYGGVKKGQRQAPVAKGPSEKAQLKAELEAMKAKLAALESKPAVEAAPDTVFDTDLQDILTAAE
jgi:hypothetical protein